MAILVVKSSPAELASIERSFPAEPIMVSEARRLAAQTFGSWGMDTEQIELACLLVSEVVTNAVLHASVTPSPGRRLDFDFDLDPLVMSGPVGSPRTPEPVPIARPRGRSSAAVSAAAVSSAAVSSAAGSSAAVSAGVRAAAATTRAAAVPVQGGAVPGWDDGAPEAGRIGPREFALRLRRGATAVWVEVFDPDLRLPRIRTAAETDEGGRGLYLVEQLATRWGSRPTPEGKAVWFEMPRSGRRPLRPLSVRTVP
jgi:hypothetical protein